MADPGDEAKVEIEVAESLAIMRLSRSLRVTPTKHT
jgi:hypothetical protein